MLWLATALAADLSGTVTAADGAPVAGASVTAYDARFNYAQATTRTGGQWEITGLPSGTYRVRVETSANDPRADAWLGNTWSVCASDLVPAAEGEQIAGLDSTLSIGGVVSGTVLDQTGAPVPDAVAVINGADERTALVQRYARTDAAGAFSVVGVDGDIEGSPFTVSVSAEGWPEQLFGGAYSEALAPIVAVSLGTTTELGDFPLLDGISVSGTVLSDAGPVESGTVYVYASSQVLISSISTDGAYVADGLPPGDVVAWASSDGLATTYFPDSDRPGESVSVPDEAGSAQIDFFLPEDNPIELHFSGEGDLSLVTVLVYNDAYTVGRGAGVGSDGVATLRGFYPGNYYVYVYGEDGGFESGFLTDDAGELAVIAVDGPTTAAVPLRSAATLSGVVRDDAGEPVYGATVTASETAGAERQWSATTDHDGQYEIRGVAPTTVEVLAQWYWYCPNDPGWVDTWWHDARSSASAALVQTSAGTAIDALDLTMPVDRDHDNMGDAWEEENGLDPTVDDAASDPDTDGYTNIEEWVLDTDPTSFAAADGCGCAQAPSSSGMVATGWLLSIPLWRRKYAMNVG